MTNNNRDGLYNPSSGYHNQQVTTYYTYILHTVYIYYVCTIMIYLYVQRVNIYNHGHNSDNKY